MSAGVDVETDRNNNPKKKSRIANTIIFYLDFDTNIIWMA